MKYKGSCHCGDNAFEVEGTLEKALECNCSICVRKGYLLWFVPMDCLNVTTPDGKLVTYTFHQKMIQHQFCPRCGCAPYGTGKDPAGNEMAAINVRCLEDIDLAGVERTQFDGRSL